MATDTNRTGLSYAVEISWGATPAIALTDIRFTGESLSYNISNVQSAEIRSDRQVTDIIQTGADCSGGFNFELSYSEFDDFFQGALWSSGWSTACTICSSVATGTTIGIDIAGRITRTGVTGQTFASLTTGQWIRLSGCSAAGNNGFYRITSTAATALTVVPLPFATAASGTDIVAITGSYIRNGVTERSYTFEREHSDAVQFFDYTGMVVNSMNISASADSIVTGSFDFIGKSASLAQTSGGTGANAASTTNPVVNASSNVGSIYEGAFASLATKDTDLYISEISFSLANGVRGLRAIGSMPNVDVGVGTCEVTGTLNAYFLDETLYEKYINGTETGLSFQIIDGDGNAYIFTFPAIEFESDAINSGGQNQDVMENISWRAKRSSVVDCTIQIDKFAI